MTDQVYMIQHNTTGRMYIGRSRDVQTRVKAHFYALRSGRHAVEDMQKDFDSYGDNFTISILGEIKNTSLHLEQDMMEKYQSTIRGIGYNYNDPHITNAKRNKGKIKSIKAQLVKLIYSLDDNEALYAYTFFSKMFGSG